MPKYAFVAFRPENFEEGKEALQKIMEIDYPLSGGKWHTTHIRIANDFSNRNAGSLVVSKSQTNGFKFYGWPLNALKKWDFLMPGLKEYCGFYCEE